MFSRTALQCPLSAALVLSLLAIHFIPCVSQTEDPCAQKCHVFANCEDQDGNFTCTCFPGYFGDGLECADRSFAVRTFIQLSSESAFNSHWPLVRDAYANVLATESGLATSIANSAVMTSSTHGVYGAVVAIHALYGTKADAEAGWRRLQQFSLAAFEQELNAQTGIIFAVINADVKPWSMQSGFQLDSFVLGLSVDSIQFDGACGSFGCWVVDVSYNNPGADIVVLYLPRTEGVADESGSLQYSPETEATFKQNQFPCSLDNIEDSRSFSLCCLADAAEKYRVTEDFDTTWQSLRSLDLPEGEQSVADACNDPGLSTDVPTTLFRPGQEFSSGKMVGLPASVVERLGDVDVNRVGVRLKLDDQDLWTRAGMSSFDGLSRQISTFVGAVRLQPASDTIMVSVAEQKELQLTKKQYFAFVSSASFAPPTPAPNERSASFNAELRLTQAEACASNEDTKTAIQDKVAASARQATTGLLRVEVTEFEVRKNDGACPGDNSSQDGVRSTDDKRARQGRESTELQTARRAAAAAEAAAAEAAAAEAAAAEERQQQQQQQGLTLSEGSFVVTLVFGDEPQVTRLNLDRLRATLPALLSIQTLDSSSPVVIDNTFDPTLELTQPPPSTDNPAPPPNPTPATQPSNGDPADEDNGNKGVPVLGAVVAAPAGMLVLIGTWLAVRRYAAKRSPDMANAGVTRQGKRRTSAMALLSSNRRLSVASAPEPDGLGATDVVAAVEGEEALSPALAAQARRNSLMQELRDDAMSASPASLGADATHVNARRSSTPAALELAGGAGSGRRKSSTSLLNLFRGADDTSQSNAGQPAPGASAPNRRGSIQVVVLEAAVQPATKFNEVGLMQPQVAEPGQSVTFRPPKPEQR